MGNYRIQIRKQGLKFSSAHMTVFPDGTKESLHGHNYQVSASFAIQDASLEKMISFSIFKKGMKSICEAWDEKLLLAENCPKFEIKKRSADELEFLLCGRRYVIPAEEVVLLPLDNIITEGLAELFCKNLLETLGSVRQRISGLEISIEETGGQSAAYLWRAK